MKPKLIFNFDYTLHPFPERLPWSAGFQLMEALREYFDVYRRGDMSVMDADVVFNMQPSKLFGGIGNDIFIKGKLTFWWDVLPLEHIDKEYFNMSDVVFYNSPSLSAKYPDGKRQLLLESVDYWGYYAMPEKLIYDVGFLGSEVEAYRIDLLNRLGKKYSLLRGSTALGPPSAKLLSQCKLVLSIQDWHNRGNSFIERRVFTFGNVRPLLIHYNKDYDAVGKPMVDYIPYLGEEELHQRIDYFLTHEEERETIGKHMIQNLWNHHRSCHRALQIYKTYETLSLQD